MYQRQEERNARMFKRCRRWIYPRTQCMFDGTGSFGRHDCDKYWEMEFVWLDGVQRIPQMVLDSRSGCNALMITLDSDPGSDTFQYV